MKRPAENPEKSRLAGWLLYSSPLRRPHEALIDAGLVHQLDTGAWVLTSAGRTLAGEPLIAGKPQRGG